MKKIIINSLIGTVLVTSFTGCLATKDVEVAKEKKIYKKTIECYGEKIGSEKIIDGVSYLVVDNNTIRNNLHRAETLCTSYVTDMSKLFKDREKENRYKLQDEGKNTIDIKNFNKDISSWDVSNVTNMYNMFYGAESFNQDIGNWRVYKVESMAFMFHGAKSFNQDIGNWIISKNMKSMSGMFSGASSFNQDISKWCPYNLEDEINELRDWMPLYFVDKDSKMKKSYFQKSYLPDFKHCTTFKERNEQMKKNQPEWAKRIDQEVEKAGIENSNKLRRLQNEATEKFNNRR